jgi:hypothetical protein
MNGEVLDWIYTLWLVRMRETPSAYRPHYTPVGEVATEARRKK